jgi:chromosome segregation ATPase
MQSDVAADGGALDMSAVDAESTAAVATPVREGVNLRVLLELRRHLKSAAEKQLSLGGDRVRRLRNEVRHAESELRLCSCALQACLKRLGEASGRVEAARDRARESCARLSSLERENEDLAEQLHQAEGMAGGLQLSVRAGSATRNGALESFMLATCELRKELCHGVQDQRAIRTRAHDLFQDTEGLAHRAGSLHTCLSSIQGAASVLCDEIAQSLDGASAFVGEAAQADRSPEPSGEAEVMTVPSGG